MSKKLLGPEVGYVDLLDAATADTQVKDQSEGKHYSKTPLRPSAAGKCSRELYYEMMMFTGKASYPVETMKPEVVRLLGLGHSIEWHVIKQFEQHLKMVQVKYKQQMLSFGELKAANDPAITQLLEGSLDVCFVSDQWKCVVDFKSKKDKYSSYRGSQWDETTDKLSKMRSVQQLSEKAFWVEDLGAFLNELNDPFFEANFVQLNLYATSDFLTERGIDHAAIIQYNKNDSRLREIRFKPSPKIAKAIKAKFQNVMKAVDENKPELAPQDYVVGSMKCAFCSFKKECWNEDTLKSYFKTFPKKQWPTDLHKVGDVGKDLEKLLATYQGLDEATKAKDAQEQSILKLMVDNQLTKIRTETGEVFEARYLKSPHPHFELRRSKT